MAPIYSQDLVASPSPKKKQHLQPELLLKHPVALLRTQSVSNKSRAAEGFLVCRDRINTTCVNIL